MTPISIDEMCKACGCSPNDNSVIKLMAGSGVVYMGTTDKVKL